MTMPSAPRILVVDDEEAVRFVIVEMLLAEGFEAEPAANAEEALERLADGSPFDLVIADASLGGSAADCLAQCLCAPDSPPVLVVSGHLDATLGGRLGPRHEVPFLAKPFSAGQLFAEVRRILCATGRG